MQKIHLILGPPGSGKTTYTKRLMRFLDIKKRYHVAWYVRTNGKNKFKIQTRRGSFVPKVSYEFLEYVKWHSAEEDCIIDGFPRNVGQAKILLKTFPLKQISLLQITSSKPDLESWSFERQFNRAVRWGKKLDRKLYRAKINRFLRYEIKAIDFLKEKLSPQQVYEVDCSQPLNDSITQLKEKLVQNGYEIQV